MIYWLLSDTPRPSGKGVYSWWKEHAFLKQIPPFRKDHIDKGGKRFRQCCLACKYTGRYIYAEMRGWNECLYKTKNKRTIIIWAACSPKTFLSYDRHKNAFSSRRENASCHVCNDIKWTACTSNYYWNHLIMCSWL